MRKIWSDFASSAIWASTIESACASSLLKRKMLSSHRGQPCFAAEKEAGKCLPFVVGMRTHKRELLITKTLDAEPDHREEIPGNTIVPLLLALTTTIGLWGAIFFAWWFTTGTILTAIVLLFWFWPKREDVEEHLENERKFTMKRGGEVPA